MCAVKLCVCVCWEAVCVCVCCKAACVVKLCVCAVKLCVRVVKLCVFQCCNNAVYIATENSTVNEKGIEGF